MAKHFAQKDINSLLQQLNKHGINKNSTSKLSDKNNENKKRKTASVEIETESGISQVTRNLKKQKQNVIEERPRKVQFAKEFSKEQPSERSQKLRNSCLEKLMEAQFRSINEYLYQNTSISALTYMNDELFEKYHDAYRKIVDRWPVKPLDVIIDYIKKHNLHIKKNCTIADMGCGDARLAQYFTKYCNEYSKEMEESDDLVDEDEEDSKVTKPKSLSVIVHSFDLVSTSPIVTQASMDNVPLDSGSCDIVVFSLSLMGTNIKDYLLEANRILRKNGNLLIVEVASRFEETSASKFNSLLESFNFKMSKLQFLKPNDFFVFFTGRKTETVTKLKGLPQISLKACKYKLR